MKQWPQPLPPANRRCVSAPAPEQAQAGCSAARASGARQTSLAVAQALAAQPTGSPAPGLGRSDVKLRPRAGGTPRTRPTWPRTSLCQERRRRAHPDVNSASGGRGRGRPAHRRARQGMRTSGTFRGSAGG